MILLLLAFLLVPIAEIYVLVQVGQAIGAWQTIVLLIVWSALGAALVKREGRRAWTAFRSAAGSGRMPGREVADAALVMIGGVLLLTPGFITDVAGLFLVLPFTRPLARRALLRYGARRATVAMEPRLLRVRAYRGPGGGASGSHRMDDRVVDGEPLRRPEPPER